MPCSLLAVLGALVHSPLLQSTGELVASHEPRRQSVGMLVHSMGIKQILERIKCKLEGRDRHFCSSGKVDHFCSGSTITCCPPGQSVVFGMVFWEKGVVFVSGGNVCQVYGTDPSDFYRQQMDAVDAQVQRLIQSAIDPENLAKSFVGWCPFW